jgi:hypothetical protein
VLAAKESIFKFGVFVPRVTGKPILHRKHRAGKPGEIWNDFGSAFKARLMEIGPGIKSKLPIRITKNPMLDSSFISMISSSLENIASV